MKNRDAPEFVTSTGEYGAQIRRLQTHGLAVLGHQESTFDFGEGFPVNIVLSLSRLSVFPFLK